MEKVPTQNNNLERELSDLIEEANRAIAYEEDDKALQEKFDVLSEFVGKVPNYGDILKEVRAGLARKIYEIRSDEGSKSDTSQPEPIKDKWPKDKIWHF